MAMSLLVACNHSRGVGLVCQVNTFHRICMIHTYLLLMAWLLGQI